MHQGTTKKSTPILKFGTCNIQTMRPVLSEDLQEIDDARKTAVLNTELCRLQLDIVALQETRLSASGTLREKDYTFFWQGKAPEEKREHGVGFAIKNSLLGCIIAPSEG